MFKKSNRILAIFLAVVMTALMLPSASFQTRGAATLVWPVPATKPGVYTTYEGHIAMDIAGGMSGTAIVAAIGGEVVEYFTCPNNHYYDGSSDGCYGYGTGMVIRGEDGRYYHYAHMQAGSNSHLKKGSTVSTGQEIGKVGQTGNASGPHLHFAISQQDPIKTYTPGPIEPSKETYITLDDWIKLHKTYTLDVNLTVDGKSASTGHESTTFDVYINGSRVSSGVKDFCTSYTTGTKYEIKNINVGGCYKNVGNGSYSGTLNGNTTVVIPIVTSHTPVYSERTEPTCTKDGVSEGAVCSVCGKTITATETIPALGHDYNGEFIPADCENDAYMQYVCSRCGDSYTGEIEDKDKYNYTEWTAERPEKPENGEIEEAQQYKFRKKDSKTGDSIPNGYTKDGEKWVETGSGSIDFAKSWPAGFDTNNSLYAKYNKSVSASETGTSKRTVSAASKIGYIYWHWCRNYNGGPVDRLIADERWTDSRGQWTTFHAFFSETDYEYRTFSSADPAYYANNPSVCKDTFWWINNRVEIDRVSYTDYKKQYTYSAWGEWSDWQLESVESGDNCEVETRTVYRIKTEKEGLYASGHKWDDGIVTLEPTATAPGTKTFTCALCKATKTEEIKPTETDPQDGIKYGDADGNDTIDLIDCMLVMDFFNHKNVKINETAADANGDGSIDLIDCMLIMDFFNHKNVTLGPVAGG